MMGKWRIGSFFSSNEGIEQVTLKFKEELPQLVDAVFCGPFPNPHALKRFKVRAHEDTHFDIELSIDDWTAIGQYIMKGPSLRYLDLKDLVLGSEHNQFPCISS